MAFPTHQKHNRAGDCYERGQQELPREVWSRDDDVSKANQGQHGRKWVEPDAKRARKIGLPDAEHHHAHVLHGELQHDAQDDECGNEIAE